MGGNFFKGAGVIFHGEYLQGNV